MPTSVSRCTSKFVSSSVVHLDLVLGCVEVEPDDVPAAQVSARWSRAAAATDDQLSTSPRGGSARRARSARRRRAACPGSRQAVGWGTAVRDHHRRLDPALSAAELRSMAGYRSAGCQPALRSPASGLVPSARRYWGWSSSPRPTSAPWSATPPTADAGDPACSVEGEYVVDRRSNAQVDVVEVVQRVRSGRGRPRRRRWRTSPPAGDGCSPGWAGPTSSTVDGV